MKEIIDFPVEKTIITSREAFRTYDIEITNIGLYESHVLDNDFSYIVLGDLEGDLEKLRAVIAELDGKTWTNKEGIERISLPDNQFSGKKQIFIMSADSLIKGQKASQEMVEMVFANNRIFKILRGPDRYVELTNSIEDAKLKLIVDEAMSFYQTESYVISNSICRDRFIGKIDEQSLKEHVGATKNDYESVTNTDLQPVQIPKPHDGLFEIVS